MKNHRFFNKPVIIFIMSIIPSTWFCFFSVFFQQYPCFYKDNKLTPLAILLNLFMLLITFIFSVGTIIEKYKQTNQSLNEEKIYNSIISNIGECSTILRNKEIESLSLPTTYEMSLFDYRSAVYTITINLLSCLTEITGVERSAFVATYFFRIGSTEDWMSVSSDEGYKGIKQSDLIKNDSSVVYQLLKKSSCIFYSSKESALKQQKYIPDQRDLSQKEYHLPMGSIFGAKWIILDCNGKNLFESVITIATYGKEICTEEDGFTKKTLIENVLSVFKHHFLQSAFSCSLLYSSNSEECKNDSSV